MKTAARLVVYFAAFAAGIALVSLLYAENILLTVLFIIGAAVALKFHHKRHDIYMFVLGAVLGTIAEIIAVNAGAWQYTNPTFLVPVWLPLAWGLFVLLLKLIVSANEKIKKIH